MPVKVEIDRKSGFCGGVIRAIGTAEKFLAEHPGSKLYSLGAIVHNEEELSRLEDKGLMKVDADEMEMLSFDRGEALLIRAHGEPPKTYMRAEILGFRIIDCTCPVVLNLQKEIRAAYARLHNGDERGQILIFGKIGHAEVLGLVGQVAGDTEVVESVEMMRALADEGKIRLDGPIEIFSQTTKDPEEYIRLVEEVRSGMKNPSRLTVHDTICSQVASRHSVLSKFAVSHDVIVFVSGAESSNGQVLCDLCAEHNSRTHHIASVSEIDPSWFRDGDDVGVCGATSTPKWLLEEVSSAIQNLAL